MAMAKKLTLSALVLGAAVPILYFGIQIAAAPFYPGYSFLSRDASSLGSDRSSFPAIFNVGSLILGLLSLIASWGFFSSFRRLGLSPLFGLLVSLAVVAFGLGSINAFLFPLPDPRHTSSVLATLGGFFFLLPFLLPISIWRLPDARAIKIYCAANIVAIVGLVPIMSGLVQRWSMMAHVEMPRFQNFLNNYQGLLQRIAAAVVIVPIGVTALFLARRIRDLDQ
jgi:hypothetical membrane protein